MQRIMWTLLATLVMLSLAGCGGDDNDDQANQETPATPAVTPDLSIGAGLEVSAAGPTSALPGCSDPNNTECPAALTMTLDGVVSAAGISLSYPERYFTATTGDTSGDTSGDTLPADAPEGTVIAVAPSENNRYDEKAHFSVYWSDSVEAALAGLTEPETAPWTAGTRTGMIGVSKDAAQDPPVTITIGALTVDDSRVLVLRLDATGTYGWDLWSLVFTDMLESLAVAEE